MQRVKTLSLPALLAEIINPGNNVVEGLIDRFPRWGSHGGVVGSDRLVLIICEGGKLTRYFNVSQLHDHVAQVNAVGRIETVCERLFALPAFENFTREGDFTYRGSNFRSRTHHRFGYNHYALVTLTEIPSMRPASLLSLVDASGNFPEFLRAAGIGADLERIVSAHNAT